MLTSSALGRLVLWTAVVAAVAWSSSGTGVSHEAGFKFDPTPAMNLFPQSALQTLTRLDGDIYTWPINTVYVDVNATWQYSRQPVHWNSGFYTGLLYLIANDTASDQFFALATSWTLALAEQSTNTSTSNRMYYVALDVGRGAGF